MHGLAEGLFQMLLEGLGFFFGEQAKKHGCAWAVLWILIVAAIGILLAMLA